MVFLLLQRYCPFPRPDEDTLWLEVNPVSFCVWCGETDAAGVRAAQRWASPAPLAGVIDGTTRRHATRMENAPGLMTRQRRQVRAMLGMRG
jgi:hypothetical protein